MAVSPFSSSLRARPGYVAPPPTTAAYAPNYPALPTTPTSQFSLADEARAPYAAARAANLAQLPWMAQLNQTALTNIQSGAKMNLAGYGGWSFGTDDPATAQREDLLLNYDPRQALKGERNKQDYRSQINQASDRGLLYSSMANQNIAAGQQRLTLEAQQIANQYAAAINTQQTTYANQVSSVVQSWTQQYGQDAAWLSENPPEPAAVAMTPAQANPAPYDQAKALGAPAGYAVVWTGSGQPNSKSFNDRFGNNWGIIRKGGKYYVIARPS